MPSEASGGMGSRSERCKGRPCTEVAIDTAAGFGTDEVLHLVWEATGGGAPVAAPVEIRAFKAEIEVTDVGGMSAGSAGQSMLNC